MKLFRTISFCLIIMLCSSIVILGQENNQWEIFRGDPSLSGYTRARIPENPKLLWNYQTEDAITSAPIIADGKIFAGNSEGILFALDMKGNLLWQFETDNTIEAPVLYYDGVIYCGNLSGYLYALNADTAAAHLDRYYT